jgi:transcriptional regulator with XRE-family HTH domain
MKYIYKKLGSKIVLIRKSKKMTQDELSKKLNLTRASIVNIEKGTQAVTIDKLYKIAHILDCKIIDLLLNQKEVNSMFESESIFEKYNLSELDKKKLLKAIKG